MKPNIAAAFRAYLTDEHARYDQKEETAPAGNRGLTRSDTTGRG